MAMGISAQIKRKTAKQFRRQELRITQKKRDFRPMRRTDNSNFDFHKRIFPDTNVALPKQKRKLSC